VKSTILTGTDYPVTDESYAAVLWLLKKYTSFTYIERAYRLLATFNREYNTFAGTPAASFTAEGYRDAVIRLYDYQARFERGLLLLKSGDKSGYREISEGTEFVDYVFSRRFEYGDSFQEVGFRHPGPSVGIFAWIDRAATMAVQIRRTLQVEWTFERLLTPPVGPPPVLPDPLPPLTRSSTAEIIGKGDEVPRIGIWEPVDVPRGCPNYLRPGMRGVPVLVPSKRIDDPLQPGEPTPPRRAVLDYEFREASTRWQLLWEDRRYARGAVPDGAVYLDSATEFPQDGVIPIAAIDQA
jgi:hypothetical protein